MGVAQKRTAKGQMNVEMAMWAKKAPLPHADLLFIKAKRSSYSIKKKKKKAFIGALLVIAANIY